jgi:hypothetical protein
MTSSESSASAEDPPVDRQAGGVSAVPGVLAAAARALAGAPEDADDAALLAILARAIVPALGDVVEVRRLGERAQAGQQPELVAPLGGDASRGDLLVIRSTDPAREYGEAERSAAEVLAALVGARRAAGRQAAREAMLRQQVETLSLAGRELAHALNNDLTMPVGVIELLTDRTGFSPDLQEMLQAAAKDLAALEQHVRTFHDLMRAQTGSGTAG